MYSDGAYSEYPFASGEFPLSALQSAIKQLQHAITIAPKDKAAAAAHIELALPYFAEALTWGRKGGRKRKAKGETVGERRLRLLEQGISMEDIAAIEDRDIDVIRRSLGRGRERSGQ
jgi:hypothetical protein